MNNLPARAIVISASSVERCRVRAHALCVQAPPEEKEAVEHLVLSLMASADAGALQPVPLEVDICWGRDWAECSG